MAAPTLDDCTAFLQRPNKSVQGNTVFGHVSEILLKLVEERPVNPVDVFEEVSAAVKQSSYSTSDAPLRPSYEDHPSLQWARDTVDQLSIKGPGEDANVGAEEGCTIANLAQHALMFESAGIGLSPHEATALTVGLRKLAQAEPVSSARFWGKITGTTRDYLIAECTYQNPSAHEPAKPAEAAESKPGTVEPVEPEKLGEGLNKFVYYVVGYTLGPDGVFGHYTYDRWVKLPSIRPEHIMAARQIKKMFSGDLEAPVNSYPPFPGKEAEYLAAQVARIAHGATMTVEGMWSVGEDEETGATVIKQKEVGGEDPYEVKKTGAEGLTAEEGAWKAAWVHHPQYPCILTKMGRCSWPVKEVPEGEEPPEDDEEKEEAEPLNKSLEEEVGVGSIDPFSVRLATPVLNDFSPAVLHSNRWPGAYTMVLETTCVNVYVGNGLKYTGAAPFQVVMPPTLPEECSELLPGEDGSEEPGPPRPGMAEQLDESMPDPFLVVEQDAAEGEGDEDAG